ncbi:MAG: hypothetical protein FWH15_00335 [Betaproteobacteria bacterium]|nr:hypothetical protein [Betaproteobacteria bacterium]
MKVEAEMKTRTGLGIAGTIAALIMLAWLSGCTGEPRGLEAESGVAVEESGVADLALPVSDCDPGLATCVYDMPDGGSLEIDLSERPLRALHPFTARATLEAAQEVRAMRLTLSGADMDMGTINHVLEPDSEGNYRGEVVLPMCMSGNAMRWRADFTVEFENRHMVMPFILSTAK